jgi:predicted nucleic acid-binding protein
MPNAPTAERVLVDTSVWVDFFRNQPAAVALVGELAETHRAAICGTILQETMQGAKSDQELSFLRTQMSLWHFEAEQPEDFAAAAEIYARLRWRGLTVPPADCLIAAVAIRRKLPLCSPDAHFSRMPGLTFEPVSP